MSAIVFPLQIEYPRCNALDLSIRFLVETATALKIVRGISPLTGLNGFAYQITAVFDHLFMSSSFSQADVIIVYVLAHESKNFK